MDQGHGPNPSPLPNRKRHRDLCGRLSGWGGLPQRSQRAQMGIGKGGMQLRQSCFLQRPWSAGNRFPQNPPPNKRMDQGHGPNPSPLPDRKRHRDLCGRLSGSGRKRHRDLCGRLSGSGRKRHRGLCGRLSGSGRKRHRGLSGRHSGFESFGLPDGVLSCLVLIWKDSYSHVFGRWAGGLGWTGSWMIERRWRWIR